MGGPSLNPRLRQACRHGSVWSRALRRFLVLVDCRRQGVGVHAPLEALEFYAPRKPRSASRANRAAHPFEASTPMASLRDAEVGVVGKAEIRPELRLDVGRWRPTRSFSGFGHPARRRHPDRPQLGCSPTSGHGSSHCSQELLKLASIFRRYRLEILAISSPLGSNRNTSSESHPS